MPMLLRNPQKFGIKISTSGIVIHTTLIGCEASGHIKVAACNQIILAQEDTNDRRQEDPIRGKEGDKDRRTAEQIPRINRVRDDSGDEEFSLRRDEFRNQCCEVVASRKKGFEDGREDRTFSER